MKRIDLIQVKHNIKVGQKCPEQEPNVKEDSIFYLDGEPIGFYLKRMPEKMCKLAGVSNQEFQTKNVPKTLLDRSDVLKAQIERPGLSRKDARKIGTSQMSTILGGVPPKPQFMRYYPTISSVHSVASAQTFIKAMLLLAKESEALIKEIIPQQYERQLELFTKVQSKWKFGNLFTSSISNFNISAPYHRDTGNIVGSVNVIVCKKQNSIGGDLNVPDYGLTVGQQDNSILVYPAWKNIHGVTPIVPTKTNGYRNSLVFYPLKAFLDNE